MPNELTQPSPPERETASETPLTDAEFEAHKRVMYRADGGTDWQSVAVGMYHKSAEFERALGEPLSPDDERANPVWDLVIAACCRAWSDKRCYSDSPVELIADIINERDELRVDAERYRWLRDDSPGQDIHVKKWDAAWQMWSLGCLAGADLDAAIDTARLRHPSAAGRGRG